MSHIIRCPPQLVAGIVRHREPNPATVVVGVRAEPIKANSCYAWVNEDAEVWELQLLLEQVLKILASKETET